LFSLTIGNLEL